MNKKIKNKKFNVWKIENLFYLKSNLSRILKIVCHYEIFKITKNVKGDILGFQTNPLFVGTGVMPFLVATSGSIFALL